MPSRAWGLSGCPFPPAAQANSTLCASVVQDCSAVGIAQPLLVSPQVFSSAKYPAPERLQEYSSIFAGAEDPAKQKWPRHKIQSKHRVLDEKALQVRRRAGLEMSEQRGCEAVSPCTEGDEAFGTQAASRTAFQPGLLV